MKNSSHRTGLSSKSTPAPPLPPPHHSTRVDAPVFRPAANHAPATAFVLQPVFDLAFEGPVVAYYEVLARGPFVASLLEHSHVELLELSCRFAATVLQTLGVPILVNVEPHSLNQAPWHAAAVIAAAGCHVEVTERGGLTETALDALREVRRSGAELWLDDFGTGDSTVDMRRALLAEDLVTGVKLHVDDCSGSPASFPLIIEGVETEEHLAAARRRGASLVQGYLLGRPAPLESYLACRT